MLISRDDLIYTAGFFDGEGCACISRTRNRQDWGYMAEVHLTNTNKDVLLWIQKTFRLGHLMPQNRHGNRKPCWRLDFYKLPAKEFLTLLRPFLRVKRQQAELVLEFIEMSYPRGGTRTSEHQIMQEVLYGESREINKRGL